MFPAAYSMQSYRDTLEKHDIFSNMSRKGGCCECEAHPEEYSSVVESFFANLKNELIYWRNYKNQNEARCEIFDYIEIFYNRQRLHQTLDYQSLEQFQGIKNVA